jgi:hypothetical protein
MQTQGATTMTKPYLLAILTALLLALPLAATAGNLEPIAGPDDNSTAMYTLEDIYNRAATGDNGTKRIDGFTEPEASPVDSKGRTLDEIMSAMPESRDNAAQPEDVLEGKNYWSLDAGDGSWGQQQGTNNPRKGCPSPCSMVQTGGKDVCVMNNVHDPSDWVCKRAYDDGTEELSECLEELKVFFEALMYSEFLDLACKEQAPY